MELTSNTDTHWRSEELFFCLELRSTTDTHWPSEELFFWLWNDLNFGNLLLAVPLNVLPNNKEYRYYGMVLCFWYGIYRPLDSLTVWPSDLCGRVTVFPYCVAKWLMWPSDCVAEWLCGRATVWPSDCVAEWLCGRTSVWPSDYVAGWHVAEWHVAECHVAECLWAVSAIGLTDTRPHDTLS